MTEITGFGKKVPYIIDLFVVSIWGIMTVFIIFKALKLLDSDNKVDFTAVLGIYAGVTGLATQIVSFHRGSSQGSADKSRVIHEMKK